MAKDIRLSRCRAFYKQFVDLNPKEIETMPIAFSDFDGLSLAECKKTLRFVMDIFDGLSASENWEDVTWHAYTSLEGLLQNLVNTYLQFKNQRDQSSFQQFCQNLDSLAYHCRMFGLPSLALGGAQVEKIAAALNTEMERVVAARAEIAILQKEVKDLITPGIAGSLSQAFTQRKNILFRGRVFWGVVALLIGYFCIDATYALSSAINTALTAISDKKLGQDFLWASVVSRTAILVPLYAGFGFSFGQYRNEPGQKIGQRIPLKGKFKLQKGTACQIDSMSSLRPTQLA
jgi:hypothetical protein